MVIRQATGTHLLDGQDGELTVDDWFNLPDSTERYELHEGMLVMAPPPDGDHQDNTTVLATALTNYAMAVGGWTMVAPTGVALSSIHGYEPDVLYLRPGSLAKRKKRGIQGAPDLVVEVLSPGTRRYDIRSKLPAYLEHGVEEVWLVDPRAKTVVVHRKDEPPAMVRFGERIPSKVVDIGSGMLERIPPITED